MEFFVFLSFLCCRQSAQFICDVCGRQFQFQSSLKAHAGVHRDAFPYTCQICGKGFKVASSLMHNNFQVTLHQVIIHQYSKFGCRVQGL